MSKRCRDQTLQVKVSQDEKAWVEDYCDRQGYSVSAFLRAYVLSLKNQEGESQNV